MLFRGLNKFPLVLIDHGLCVGNTRVYGRRVGYKGTNPISVGTVEYPDIANPVGSNKTVAIVAQA